MLLPISLLFCALVFIRSKLYATNILKSERLPVPIIIVGNITAGGSGKTPLVIALIDLLVKAGYKPGIISRGYGGRASSWPQQVREDSDPNIVGDEPVMMAASMDVPVAVGPERVITAQQLLQYHDCDVIVSDDGMQHYALERDIEIAVVDGVRRFGNGFCLPAGPLREPVSRLERVDFVVSNGLANRLEYPMELIATGLYNLATGEQCDVSEFSGKTVHAVAGIGNPQRFFSYLQSQNVTVIEHPFSDHYRFKAEDINFAVEHPIILTSKDAVKCKRFANENVWVLQVKAKLDDRFVTHFLLKLKKIDEDQNKHE